MTFGWSVFVVHVWAILNILVVLPSWALRLGLSELMGVTAYPLAFALLESLVVWVLAVALGFVLPRKLLREDFVSQAATLISILSIVAVILHFTPELVFRYRLYTAIFLLFSSGAALYLSYLAGKSQKYRDIVRNVLSRVSILSWIYVFLDLVAIVIILIRAF